MAGMEGLGRLFNVVPIAAGTLISLKDASGVTFVCTGDDTFTVKSAPSFNGGAADLTAIVRVYKNASTAGADAWTDSGDIAAVDSVTIASGAAAFYIDSSDLPAGSDYVEVAVAAEGLVAAIVHDLAVQRGPKNLRPLSGASS